MGQYKTKYLKHNFKRKFMVNVTRNLVRILFLVVVLLLTATYGMANVQKQGDLWLNPVVTEGELGSTTWIKSNTQATDHFQSDILSLIHISEPTRRTPISYAVF